MSIEKKVAEATTQKKRHQFNTSKFAYLYDVFRNTDSPMRYCMLFIKWVGNKHISDTLESAIEQWIDAMKGELKKTIEDNFAPARWGDIKYNIQFENLYTVKYDCAIGFYAKLKSEFFNNDQSELRLDMIEYYEPHQYNIKTYLEDRMDEVINGYFSQY